jgi:hypothetical protein
VTDPSGKTLLSQDAASCRQFDVANGIITNVVVTGCQHQTGVDSDNGAVTVQLMPYSNTPNQGGVYKAWVTRLEDFVQYGFAPAHSKTDNFKVKNTVVREIDTRFFNDSDGNGTQGENEEWLDGLYVTWKDSLGASNKKSSYWAPEIQVYHEAHVEAVEDGTHQIILENQPGCNIGLVHVEGERVGTGPMTVNVPLSRRDKQITIFIDVACVP